MLTTLRPSERTPRGLSRSGDGR